MFPRLTSVKTLAAAAGLSGLLVAGQPAEALAQGEFGSIKGRVVWGGDEVPTPKVLVEKGKASKDPEICAADSEILAPELQVDPETKGVAGAIVYLVNPSAENADAVAELLKSEPKALLDQVACEFVPHVLAIHEDQALTIKSSDPVPHNVRYTGFTNGSLNQMLAANGEMEVKLQAERRPMMVACDIHPWMTSYVMVFDHPFFAVTGKDGSFEIKGVPAGKQNLVVWQETAGWINPGKAKGDAVDVKAGEAADAGAFELKPKKK